MALKAHKSKWLRSLRKPLLFSLARARWRSDGLIILYCHDVGQTSHPMCIPVRTFSSQIRMLAEDGYEVVSLSEALRRWEDRSASGARVVALCFDDGFEGVHEFAMPILARHGFSATVFVCAGYMGITPSWPGVESYVLSVTAQNGEVRLMNKTQIEDLNQRGWEIGAHSMSHADLCKLPEALALEEIQDSLRALRKLSRGPVTSFCYPFGSMDGEVARLAQASGVNAACGIDTGHVNRASSRMLLPRLHLDADVDETTLRAMLSPLFPLYLRLSGALKRTRSGNGV